MTIEQLQAIAEPAGEILLRQEGEGWHITDVDRFYAIFGDAALTYDALYNHPNVSDVWKLHFDNMKARGILS